MAISSQCHIISVLGGKGGVGKSHFAVNLAWAFAMELKKPALILDADQKSAGDINVLLGTKPLKTLAEVVSFSGSFSPSNLGQLVTQHKSGVHFIGAVRGPEENLKVTGSQILKPLEFLSTCYPIIVVDLGSELQELQLSILKESTAGMVVATPDLLVLNQTQRLIQDLLRLTFPLEMFHLIINRFYQGGINPQTLAQSFKVNVLGVIALDDGMHQQALASGIPAAQLKPQSMVTSGYFDIVRKLNGGLLLKLKQSNKSSIQIKPQAKSDTGGEDRSSLQHMFRGVTAESDPRNILKMRIHNELIKAMDLKKGVADTQGDPEKEKQLRDKTTAQITQIVDREAPGISRDERSRLIKEVLEEALGLGPLEDLLADPSVTEIMVNGYNKIFIEKGGKIQLSPVTFTSNAHLRNVIERIVTPLGRRIDEKTPMVDARLKDGSRVNAIIEPLAIDGPALTIRKFRKGGITAEQYIQYGSLTKPMIDFLKICVENGLNIIISGGTGSGKTSLLNMLSSFIPSHERIVTVEDAAELQLQQEHVVRLETRPPNMEGTGAVTIRDLIRNALRMRPDRIIVGETRDGAALDMLQAMNTGHDGSMTTTHANSPRECIARLETLCLMSGMDLPVRAIREQIASAVNLIVQISRLSDGSRKVVSITEVVGMQGDVVSMQEIFRFKETGYDKNRRIVGQFQAMGMIPTFIEKLEQKGVIVPRDIFSNEGGNVNANPSSAAGGSGEAKPAQKIQTPVMPKIKLTGS
ncbi:MAG: ATPase, T2SS/T4P/T4SS family [Bdellovibrionaceae bacterium]|nr:ATPase, T2SS/T4P/T4SS family [Pseudobdellovibrionaceae bacterium]MDW8189983.1 ATPase, T2SS/T4P/T4SS family [Pseudobdellovibrionaceae bacterium]